MIKHFEGRSLSDIYSQINKWRYEVTYDTSTKIEIKSITAVLDSSKDFDYSRKCEAIIIYE